MSDGIGDETEVVAADNDDTVVGSAAAGTIMLWNSLGDSVGDDSVVAVEVVVGAKTTDVVNVSGGGITAMIG